MIADQMKFEIRESYIRDIYLSTDIAFMTQKIVQRYTDELINILISGDRSEEKEALREKLDRRIQYLKVSSNSTKVVIEVQ